MRTRQARAGAASVLLFAALLVAACSRRSEPAVRRQPPAAPAKLTRVTLNFSTSHTAYAPIVIAKEEGFFADEGIDLALETVDQTSSILALTTGRLDVLSGPIRSGLFNMMLKGKALQIVADRGHSAPGRCSAEAFAAPPDVAARVAAKGLRGERFVLIRGGTTEYLIDRFLAKNGLTADDVQFAQVIPQTDQVDRQMGAIRLIGEPNLSNLTSAGLVREIQPIEEIAPGYQFSMIAFGPRLLRDDPELGRRFMRAYLRGVRQYNQGKTARNVAIVARHTRLPEETVRRACWHTIAPDAKIDPRGVESFLAWAKAKGYLEADVPTATWWNPSFIDAALAAEQNRREAR